MLHAISNCHYADNSYCRTSAQDVNTVWPLSVFGMLLCERATADFATVAIIYIYTHIMYIHVYHGPIKLYRK